MGTMTQYVQWNNVTNETYMWQSGWSHELQKFDYVSTLIWKIGLPLVLLPGIFGNIMIILIMRRISESNLNILFQVLAVSDLMVLTTSLLPKWLNIMFGTPYLEDLGSLSCKVFTMIINTTGVVSPWMLVALTMQRAASVLWPHRMNAVWTKSKSRAVAMALIIVFTLIHCHFLYGYDHDVTVCAEYYIANCCPVIVSETYDWFYHTIWPWVDLVEFSLLPFVLLALSNDVLIWKIVSSVGKRASKLAVGQSREKKVSSLTVTLITLSVSFFLLTIPISLFLIVRPYVLTPGIQYTNPVLFGQFIILWAVSSVLWYSNSAINFYLYCLTGTKFRVEFQKIMREFVSCF